jgi:hypothetical protein
LVLDVAELKNVFQSVVISETALAEPLAEPVGGGGADADDTEVEVDEEVEPIEQADTAVTSTRPSAGAR